MSEYKKSELGFTALIILISSLAYTGACYAESIDTTETPENVKDRTLTEPMLSAPTTEVIQDQSHDHPPRSMERNVENRISTLRDKLKITAAQDTEWQVVAQTMRDNESSIHQLIKSRHENAATMTAVDDLQSYADITQAHADGIKKLIVAFQALYNDLSDKQKSNADKVFSGFEGHRNIKIVKNLQK